MADSVFAPPYRYEVSEHGPATIYDAVDVGWVARVKESLPHKEALARAIVRGLNEAAYREIRDAYLASLCGCGHKMDEHDEHGVCRPMVMKDASQGMGVLVPGHCTYDCQEPRRREWR